MAKLKMLMAKLKSLKHFEIIVCVVVMIVVLLIYFSCVSLDSDKTTKDADVSDMDYCQAMQVQLENVVSQIMGVGEATIVINWDKSVTTSFGGGTNDNPQATGVIVVCDGGDSTKVKLDVTFAVSTLLNLSIEKIIVYPKS